MWDVCVWRTTRGRVGSRRGITRTEGCCMGCMVYGAVWLYAHTALYGTVCRCMAVWRQEGGGTGRGTCMERNTAKYSEIQPNSIQPAIQQTWAVCAYSRIPWRPPAVYGTQRRQAAAGLSPPPPTLTTGTLSHTQRTTAQSVPGCQAPNVKAAQSSSFCTTSRPSEPRLSSCMRQILPIAQVTDLRRENQSVNAWKQNGHPAQTARKGKAGARAG